jgi:DNA-directed RNA polymerase subunit K/omega
MIPDVVLGTDPNEESDMESEDTSLASDAEIKEKKADNEDEDLDTEDENSVVDESVDDDDDDDDNDDDDDYDKNSVVDGGAEEMLINTSKMPDKRRIDDDNDDNDDDDDDDDDDEDDDYLQKFDENIRQTIIEDFHPELKQHNDDEVEALSKVVRSVDGTIIDSLHKTLPFLTKYEKARILGERAKQLNAGANPFIKTENTLIDGYLIALRELEEKKIPFIIRRPLPHGGSEYWKLADLEILVG